MCPGSSLNSKLNVRTANAPRERFSYEDGVNLGLLLGAGRVPGYAGFLRHGALSGVAGDDYQIRRNDALRNLRMRHDGRARRLALP